MIIIFMSLMCEDPNGLSWRKVFYADIDWYT